MHPTAERLKNLILENGCPQFCSLTYTSKASGDRLTPETARHTIIVGVSLDNLYSKDLTWLKAYKPKDTDESQALLELIASKVESLEVGIGNNSAATSADAYEHLDCPGLKVHIETGDVHVSGLAHRKVVIGEPATYRVVKSRTAVTAYKKILRGEMPSSGWRQFNLGHEDTVMRIHREVLEFGE